MFRLVILSVLSVLCLNASAEKKILDSLILRPQVQPTKGADGEIINNSSTGNLEKYDKAIADFDKALQINKNYL